MEVQYFEDHMNKKNLYTKGAALLIMVVFFLIASLVLVLTIGRGVFDDLAGLNRLKSGVQSLYAAESGIEDAIYRHRNGMNYSSSETFTVGTASVTIVRDTLTDTFEFVAEGDARGAIRKSKAVLAIGDGASFNFGLQGGNGGILMSNNSSVYGNVYSNASVEGQGNATVYGDIISAGSSGLVDSIHATGSVWSHTIDNSTIDKNAYYFSAGTKTATVVGGISYPGTADQATATLPISDTKVEDWKAEILASGTVIASTSPQCISGTYTIDTNITIGNVKIECNVEMKKQGASTVITLDGPIWVVGNLSFSQGPSIVASSSLGNKSVQIIVDKESNRLTSSKVTVNQSTTFTSGNTSSYVLILSMNSSAESGGTEKAIDLAQSASGQVLVYAGHGLVDMGNSISLKEVTAYQIEISNGAQVIYESGLVNLLFTSGPGGGFVVSSWEEIE
jgi:hypothetical protein